MAIGAVGSALMQIQQVQTQQVRANRDADGDNDGSRAGEVDRTESNAGNTGSIGSTLDVMA